MKYSIIVCLLFLATGPVLAQTGSGIVRGRVLDASAKTALRQANIHAAPLNDSTLARNALSDDNGFFQIRGLPISDTLQLDISYTGYATYRLHLSLRGKQSINLGNIVLEASVKGLDTVVFHLPPVVVKNDTTEYNAAAFKTRPNAVVEDLIKKLPGLEVDANGAITFNGKPVNKIMVDGKDFFAGDLLTATRNLPADIVSKIQVTDTKTLEEAFSGQPTDGSSKTLNIKLKKGIKPLFGYITGGAGTNQRYELTGMVNHFNGPEQVSVVGSMNNLNKIGSGSGGSSLEVSNPGNGITESKTAGINYNNDFGKRVKLSGSYYFNHANTSNESTIDRKQLVTTDSSFFSNATTTAQDLSTGHRAQFSIDYAPDSLNRLNISPSLNNSIAQSTSSNNTITSTAAGQKINESSQQQHTNSNNSNYSLQAFWGRKLNKKGRLLTVNMNATRGSQASNTLNLSNNSFYKNNVVDSSGSLSQRLISNNTNNAYSLGLLYTEPLSPLLRLMVHENLSTNSSGTGKQNYILDSAGRVLRLDSVTSGSFNTTSMINSTGLSLQYRGKKWESTAGLTGLYNKISNTYAANVKAPEPLAQFNYAPQASLTYRFSKEKNIRFNYSASTQQPRPEQLQPIPDNSNPLLVKLGNPDLKTSFSQSYSLSYSGYHELQNFNAAVQYNPVSNKILNSVYYDSYGRQFSQFVNVNGAFGAGGNLGFSNTWKKASSSLRLNLGMGFNYNHDVSLVNNQSLRTTTVVLSPRAGLLYNYKDRVSINSNYTFSDNDVHYSPATLQPVQYIVQHLDNTVSLYLFGGFRVLSALNYTYNSNVPAGFNRNSLLWNLGLGQALLKNKQLLVKLLIYDVLRQQVNIHTTSTPEYIENTQANVLQQYGLLSLTYNFKSQ